MGINHQLALELPSVPGAPRASGGVRITLVQKDTPASRAGLSQGDIVIGLDNSIFDMPPDSITTEFIELLYDHRPGDTMTVTILREKITNKLIVNGEETNPEPYIKSPRQFTLEMPARSSLVMTTSKEWLVLELPIVLGVRNEVKLPPLPDIEATALGQLLIPRDGSPLTEWQPWVNEVVSRYKLEDDYNDLRERLRGIEAGDDGTRLHAVAAIHRRPAFLERYGRGLTDELIMNSDKHVRSLFLSPDLIIYLTADTLQYDAAFFEPLPIVTHDKNHSTAVDEKRFKEWFNSQMTRLVTDLDAAYGSLTPDDRAFLQEHRFELTDVLAQGIGVHTDEDEDRVAHNRRTLELGAKIDIKVLLRAGYYTGRFLLDNEDRIFGWMKAHPEVRSIDTEWGKIGFGSEEHDRWDKPEYRFIFDPGGDDFYADGAGVAASFDQPVAWIIDRKGDDAYQSTSEGAQGSGLPGVGILIDRAGNDTYIGSRWAQGTGFMGVGILIDHRGDDKYHGTEYVQGAGLFGLGVLADVEGNDRYYGTIHAQGVGFTHGLGMLIDYAGDDNGYSTGKHPTNYGDPGIFDAWSQGCGMGFRGITSGGIGMLLDVGGRNTWEAGNFSQGGGYYYGLGIFRSGGGGDDTYIGSRYGQGFCAHQAAGLFIEDGGDDCYTTRQGVVSGLAWDQSVTVFVDMGGDDRYNGGTFFSLGASAHNSFCIFLDRGGCDRYDYKPGPARAGGNHYHGGSSFSFFVDLGGEQDIYTSDCVGNDVEFAWPEYGVFRDGKGELKSPLERPELKK